MLIYISNLKHKHLQIIQCIIAVIIKKKKIIIELIKSWRAFICLYGAVYYCQIYHEYISIYMKKNNFLFSSQFSKVKKKFCL